MHEDPTQKIPQWQPISMIQNFIKLTQGMRGETEKQLNNMEILKSKPHVLNDADVQHIIQTYTEQNAYCPIHLEQCRRWRQENLTSDEETQIAEIESNIKVIQKNNQQILFLAEHYKNHTIDKILQNSDVSLALDMLTGKLYSPFTMNAAVELSPHDIQERVGCYLSRIQNIFSSDEIITALNALEDDLYNAGTICGSVNMEKLTHSKKYNLPLEDYIFFGRSLADVIGEIFYTQHYRLVHWSDEAHSGIIFVGETNAVLVSDLIFEKLTLLLNTTRAQYIEKLNPRMKPKTRKDKEHRFLSDWADGLEKELLIEPFDEKTKSQFDKYLQQFYRHMDEVRKVMMVCLDVDNLASNFKGETTRDFRAALHEKYSPDTLDAHQKNIEKLLNEDLIDDRYSNPYDDQEDE